MPTTGETCQTEDSNAFDPYAVAIRKSANVIGCVPWKISATCSLFYRERKRSAEKKTSYWKKGDINTDDNNNNYMKIILTKFIFGSLVMIRQFTKFSFLPKFVVMW